LKRLQTKIAAAAWEAEFLKSFFYLAKGSNKNVKLSILNPQALPKKYCRFRESFGQNVLEAIKEKIGIQKQF
jgi:hypothetical protein